MGCLRPATPGFIVTLTATILLAVVSFCVPLFKSVYFLKADISQGNIKGTITFGTLGYCLELSNGTTCSSPTVGYELDINSLVGNKLPIEIPNAVVKWLTYALVLHIVALILSAGSAAFGLLAHIREMSMTCCSTCVSGFAAVVAMLAFIFDLALFFTAKSRINAVGSATMGNAIWLTFAAWVMLFFSGCFYTLGRCCISKRSPRDKKNKKNDYEAGPNFSEQLRLDAVKAEADRKARVKHKESDLPAFYESQPLTGHVDGNDVYLDGHSPTKASNPSLPSAYGGRAAQGGGYSGGGYVQAPPGSRAVDEYYSPTREQHQQNNYPPHPQRQGSSHSYAPSSYAPTTYTNNNMASSPPPMPAATGYLGSNDALHQGQQYGHMAGGTTYHSATSHQQEPTNYSQFDPYGNSNPYHTHSPPPQKPAAHGYSDPYGQVGSPPMRTMTPPGIPAPANYGTPPPIQNQAYPDRSYTLGGDGYGNNSVPALSDPYGAAAAGVSGGGPSQIPLDFTNPHGKTPPPVNTNVSTPHSGATSPRGPRSHRDSIAQPIHEDSPPGYDAGDTPAHLQGNWGSKS